LHHKLNDGAEHRRRLAKGRSRGFANEQVYLDALRDPGAQGKYEFLCGNCHVAEHMTPFMREAFGDERLAAKRKSGMCGVNLKR
jgi:hypothetical protein